MGYEIVIKDGEYLIEKNKNLNWRLLLAEGTGKDVGDHIKLNYIEVAYLLFSKSAVMKDADLQKILDLGSKTIKNFPELFEVYLDLRQRRFPIRIVEQGATIYYEVFPKNTDAITAKPLYLVMVVPAEKSIPIDSLELGVTFAKERGETFVLGIVDQDGDVVYYNVDSALRFEVTLRLHGSL